jgi:hypothetical protein
MKKAVNLTVNGESCEGEVEPRTLLVHFLREQLGLTGTHVRERFRAAVWLLHSWLRDGESCAAQSKP